MGVVAKQTLQFSKCLYCIPSELVLHYEVKVREGNALRFRKYGREKD